MTNNYLTAKSKQFCVLYLNIRSLKKNLDDLSVFLVQNKLSPDLIALSETWLGKNSFFQPKINGYNYVSGKLTQRAGGVGFFVKENLGFNITTDYSIKFDNCEELLIEITTNNNKKYLFGIVYRHPVQNEITSFQKNFTNLLYDLNSSNLDYYILGDFNYCLLKDTYTDYKNTVVNLGCKQLIEEPTHPNPKYDSLIDHIYTNCFDKKNEINIVKENITDHYIVQLSIKDLKIPNSNNFPYMKTRNMKQFSKDDFCNDLKTKLKDFIETNSKDSIDCLFNKFIECVSSTIDIHAPLTKFSKKARKAKLKPWISRGILKSYKTKKKLYFIKEKTKTDVDKNNYKEYSDVLTRIKKLAKTNYYHKQIENSSKDSKKTWKIINEIISYKKIIPNSIDCIQDSNNVLIKNKKNISDILNDYFVNIGTKLGDSCDTTKVSTPDTPPHDIRNSFFLKPVSVHEVSSLIKKLDEKKSSGPNNIPNKFIKIGCSEISPVLTKLINMSFNSGVFPSILKNSTVIPVFKSGKRQLPNNYRPISLLSTFSKILERCLHKQLTSFFQKYKIIHPNQYGFQSGLSTELAISKVHQILAENMDQSNVTCGIFLDLRKAFDSVNHDILIHKLSDLGVRGLPLKLITSFLQNRNQRVYANGVLSSSSVVKCGVPQGSVMAPYFF